MALAGADLWSPVAVGVLKRHLRSELGREWNASLKAQKERGGSKVNELKTNGTVTNGDIEDAAEVDQNGGTEVVDAQKRKDVLIQSTFDIFILQFSLELSSSTEDELQALVNTVESQVELSSLAKKRLHNAAKEYWKRTGLLFGLLG